MALPMLLLGGCAHQTVADRQLATLEDGLNRETAERDRVDPRLATVHIQQEEKDKLAPVSPATIPPPRVVALGAGSGGTDSLQLGEPAAALDGEDINDTSPRPVIRVVGSGIVLRAGRGPDDRIEETLPDEPPDGALANAAPRSTGG